jgi:hypothetical protein
MFLITPLLYSSFKLNDKTSKIKSDSNTIKMLFYWSIASLTYRAKQISLTYKSSISKTWFNAIWPFYYKKEINKSSSWHAFVRAFKEFTISSIEFNCYYSLFPYKTAISFPITFRLVSLIRALLISSSHRKFTVIE